MASGALLAFGVEAALLRQRAQGGSWRVSVALARTGLWLRGFGRIGDGFRVASDDGADLMETAASGFGRLGSVRHAARFVPALAHALLPSMPPGTHPLAWPKSAR